MKKITVLLAFAMFAISACDESTNDGRAQQLETELAQLQSDYDALADQLADAQAAGATDAATIASLQATLATAQADLTAAQADLDSAQADLATLESQRDTLQGQLDAIQSLLSGLSATVTLELPFVFGDATLNRNTDYALAGSSDTVSFDQVRYWLSNLELRRQDGTYLAIEDSYYLMEIRGHEVIPGGTITDNDLVIPDLPNDRRETVTLYGIPAGVYTGVRFHVGIDPVRNGNFADYAGELHVLQNMFDIQWMWLTSYVFTKTRGTLHGATDVDFAWDNGTDDDYRQVDVSFPSAASLSVLHPHRIEIAVDVQSLVTSISPTTTPSIGAGDPANRALLADAFADMFSLVTVESIVP